MAKAGAKKAQDSSTGKKMRGEEYRNRRNRLIRAACASFERTGEVTVSDVAREAGITRELLYYYFERKEGLVAEVLDAYVEGAVMRLRYTRATFGPIDWADSREPFEFIRMVVRALRHYLFHQDGTVRSVLTASSRSWPIKDFVRAASRALSCELVDGCGLGDVMQQRGLSHDECVQTCGMVLLGVFSNVWTGGYVDDELTTISILALLGLQVDNINTAARALSRRA